MYFITSCPPYFKNPYDGYRLNIQKKKEEQDKQSIIQSMKRNIILNVVSD